MDKIDEGDYLFYCDSGSILVNKIELLIQPLALIRQDVMGFKLPLIEKQWTKKELFINMQCDDDYFHNSNQLLASFMVFRKSEFSIRFIEEYLEYSKVVENITDCRDDFVVQKDDFIDHRHDQSIFSLLYKKYGLIPFKDPSQFGRFENDYSCTRKFKYKHDIVYKLENGRYFRAETDSNSRYPVILIHYRRQNYMILKIKTFIKIIIRYKGGALDG